MEPGEFEGTTGRWHWESEQWWPEPTRAPESAPNVVIMLLDDVGFAQVESFGGLIQTPNINALADEDAVQWIEWPLPKLSEINDSNRAITEANIVQAIPYDLDGSGVSVMVYDGATTRTNLRPSMSTQS